jgi:hypothetical protein
MGFECPSFDVTEQWKTRDPDDAWENHSIWWLCANNGRFIPFFRRCGDCKKWFFAVVKHQSYCGDRCRKRHATESEEFKEHRRLYMHEYRSREKIRDAEVRQAVRLGHRRSR